MNRLVLPVALLSTVLFVPAAIAQPQADTASELVGYGDLNLGSHGGQARLDARLRAAAQRLCQVGAVRSGYAEWSAARQCFREAMQTARGRARIVIARAESPNVQIAAR